MKSADPRGLASRARALVPGLVAVLLAGCAAGPDLRRPAAPDVPAYTAHGAPAPTVSASTLLGEAQQFRTGADVDARWWRGLGSARLDALIESAFERSPTVASARATLRQAEELHSARAGSTLFPQVEGGIGAQRQRMNPAVQGLPGEAREFNLYNASIGVHYRLDLAGGNRRALEALSARIDRRRHELAGARLALAANIAATAIARARLAGQAASTQAMLESQDEQMRVALERLRLGHASADELLALQAQIEQTRATLPSLRKQLEQSEHLLLTLAGQAPGAGVAPDFTLAEFTLPARLPLVLPSELARRRPDVQAAEALLHAANADHGVAVARLYPRIDLSASLGTQALTTGALFGGGSAAWSLLGQLTQPLLDPGLPAEKRASLAALDAATANYQAVVLDALRSVADALRALEHDARALASLAAADSAAQASLESAERRHALGAIGYTELLVARQQAQQSRFGLVAAQAQRLADTAALYQALGGGYAGSSEHAGM